MIKMVVEAYNEYISKDEHKITYANDFVEWSLSNMYSDIVSNELRDFNEERSFKLLNESEVDYVQEMIKTRFKELK
jgi:Fe-S cluster assembly iron-binding protein IscA